MRERRFLRHSSDGERGFTLIELLVALMIFGLLAGAGVVMLRGGVSSQQAIGRHLDALGDVQRAIATLDNDLSQATTRISRTRAGTSAPAFFGRGAQQAEPLLQFVRGGWSNPANQRHPSLQKVEYWWREGRIERIGHTALDGAETPDPAVLLDRVTMLELRYRTARGDWLDRWVPAEPQELPVAIELVVTRTGEAPFALRFLVGPAIGQAQDYQSVVPPTEPGNGF